MLTGVGGRSLYAANRAAMSVSVVLGRAVVGREDAAGEGMCAATAFDSRDPMVACECSEASSPAYVRSWSKRFRDLELSGSSNNCCLLRIERRGGSAEEPLGRDSQADGSDFPCCTFRPTWRALVCLTRGLMGVKDGGPGVGSDEMLRCS